MAKPERGSLSVIKRALPNLPPAASPKELESRLLTGGEAEPAGGGTAMMKDIQPDVQPADVQQHAVHADVQPAVQSDGIVARATTGTRLTPRPGKRKEPVQMVTYRIPASLYDRLLRTAEYNHLNMTDIVVEAVERHLPNFPQPE